MANVSGRSRMLASVDAITGGPAASEAILAQERPPWALPVTVVAAAGAGAVGGAIGWSALLVGMVIGFIAGLVFVSVTTYWIVARVGGEVLLCRSSKLAAKAVRVDHRYPAPLAMQTGGGLISRKVSIDGRQLYVARQFMSRLETVVA